MTRSYDEPSEGRLASYRVTEPGLASLTIEYQDSQGEHEVTVNVPADVLMQIAQTANRPAGVGADGRMVCLVCGHPVIRNGEGDLLHADYMTHAYQHEARIVTVPETPLLPYVLSGEGHAGGIEYVTVLDAGGNPVEYNLPRREAVARYSAELDC